MEKSGRQLLWFCALVAALVNTQVNGAYDVNGTALQSAVAKGAVCLDGTAPRYALSRGSGSGADNWIVFVEGGGWCNSTAECYKKTDKARSGNFNFRMLFNFNGFLDQDQAVNPDFYNWNKVYVVYCDGASFMADVQEVDPATNVTYRGSRVFEAVMEELLSLGLKNAKNAILSGNSAGGLTTILHCDRFRALVPNASRLKCISDSGFFIRAQNLPGAKEIREKRFGDVIAVHQLRDRLPKSCTSKMDPSLCLFPENLVNDIQTPIFLIESIYDSFQIEENYLRALGGDPESWKNCFKNVDTCKPNEVKLLQDYGDVFLDTLSKLNTNPSRGLLVQKCYRHGTNLGGDEWNCDKSTLGNINKTIREAIGDWYFDRSSSVQLIDTEHVAPKYCNCKM